MPIWIGVYAGWVRPGTAAAMRYKGIGCAGAGALLGAGLGFHATNGIMGAVTAIIGAAVVSNLSLLVLDIRAEQAARPSGVPPTGIDATDAPQMEMFVH